MPRIRDILRINAVFAFAFLFTAGIFLAPFPAEGFIGPGTQVPGSGGGAFKLDSSGSIGFGTATAAPSGTFDDNSQGFGYVFTVASTTNPGLAIRNLFSENMYLWSARNFGNLHLYRESSILPGKVLMDITPTGNVGISVFGPNERLEVGGNVKGNAFIGNLSGEVSAGNVTSDVFGSLGLGGSYAFPASLGIATSTKTGLPEALSVYGNAYISGYVGIGKKTSGVRLLISGVGPYYYTGSARFDLLNTTYGVPWNTHVEDDGNWQLMSNGTTKLKIGPTANGTINFYSGTGNVIFNGSGSVGVGTTGPSYKLDVVGTGAVSSRVYSSDGNTAQTILKSSGYDFYIKNTAGLFQINADSNNRVTINTSGNLGIATTTPTTAKLVVASSTAGAAIDVVGGKIINLGTPSAASDATTKSYVDSVIGGGVGTGTSGQTLRHSGTAWVANSVIYNNGTNVGIGTTSPSYLLHVNGTSVAINDAADNTGARLLLLGSNTNKNWIIGNQWNVAGFEITPSTVVGGSTFSTPALFINDSSNIGIGSTSPTTKLDVVGGGAFTLPVTVGTPTATGHAATKSYVDSTVSQSGGGAWIISGTNAYFSLSGSVGIGTATPAQKLEISEGRVRIRETTANDYAVLEFGNDLTGLAGGFFAAGSTATGYGGASSLNLINIGSGLLALGTDNSVDMVIKTGGNVGIGTTAPEAKLDVSTSGAAATAQFRGSNSRLNINNANIYVTIDSDSSTHPIVLQTGSGGNVGIGTASPIGKLDVAGSVYVIGGNNLIVKTGGKIGLENSGPTDSFYLQNIGTSGSTLDLGGAMAIIEGGNVGIGSTSPGYKLDVVGTGSFSQPVIVGSPTATNHAATKSYVDSATVGQTGWTDGGTVVYNTTLTDNVGIGTTSPGAMLQVGGTLSAVRYFEVSNIGQPNIRYDDNSAVHGLTLTNRGITAAGHGSYILFSNAAGAAVAESAASIAGISENATHTGATADGALTFNTTLNGALTEKMRINSSGNVSIGTASPQYGVGLHIRAHGAFPSYGYPQLYLEDTTTDYPGLGFGGVGGLHGAIRSYGGDGFQFSTYNGSSWLDVLRLTEGGNVGINSTSPGYKLDVVGTGSFSQPVIVGSPTATNHATTKSYVDSVVGGGAGTGSFATLSVAGTSTLATTGGNVGIGTTNPTSKLHVAGELRATNIFTGNESTTPKDYVFIGDNAASWNTSGNYNTIIGWYAGFNNTGGVVAAVGAWSAINNTGTYVSALGSQAADTNQANNVSAVGRKSANLNTGADLSVIGFEGAKDNTGNKVVALGYQAAQGNIAHDVVAIGYRAAQLNSTANQFIVRQANINTTPLIQGNFSTGNVGIGTSAPDSKLHVFNGTNEALVHVQGMVNTPYDATVRLTESGNGWLGGYIRYDGSANRLILGTHDAADTTTSTDVDALFIPRGTTNVGIGTVPSYKLDVAGTGQFTQPVIVGTPTATNHAATKSYVDSAATGQSGWTDGGSAVYLTTSGDKVSIGSTTPDAVRQVTLKRGRDAQDYGGSISFYNDNYSSGRNFYLGNVYNGTDPMSFRIGRYNATNYADLVSITESGNVGIGIANPSKHLDIYGDATSGEIRFRREASYYWDVGINANSDFIFKSQTGGEIMRLKYLGNVGIGTTNPASKLNIYGTMSTGLETGLSLTNVSGKTWLIHSGVQGTNHNYLGISNYTDDPLTAPKFVIANGGNVGVGSVNPGYKLDVVGTGSFSQPVIVGTPTAAGHATTKSYVDSAAGGGVGAGSSGQTLRHNGTAWIANSVIYNNGTNVAIGTTVPTEKLTVNGRLTLLNNQMTESIIWPNVYDAGTNRSVRNIVLNSDDLLAFAVERGYTVTASRGPDSGSLSQMFTPNRASYPSWNGVTSTNPVVITISGLPNFSVDRMLIAPASRNRLPIDYKVETYDIYNAGWVTRKDVTGETSPYLKYIYLGSQEGVQQIRITVTNAGDSDAVGGLAIANIVVTSRYQDGRFTGYAVSAAGDTIWGNLAIQKSSASYTLDVVGTGQFTQPVIVGTPTVAGHATTKSYVDSMFTGSGQWTTSGTNIYSTLAGNVGIGTTSPSNKLTVGVADSSTTQASGGAVLNIFNSNSTANNYASIAFGQNGAGSNSFSRIGVQYVDRTSNSEDQAIFFSTIGGGSYGERMRISSTGNVGIGTASPSSAAGVNRFLHISGAQHAGIVLEDTDTSSKKWEFWNDGGNLRFWGQSGSVEGLFLKDGGNVGINSTSPGYRLDVVGTAQFSQPVIVGSPTATNHAATKSYVDSATVGQTGWTDGGTVVYNTTLTDNVGIGTTGPTGLLTLRYGDASVNNGMAKPILKLDVAPGVANSNVLEFRAFSSNGRVMQISHNAIGTQGIGANPTITKYNAGYGSNQIVLFAPDTVGEDTTTGGIYFNTTPTSNDTSVSTRMFIRTDGNIGIGTSVPNKNLEVAGSGDATIRLNRTGIAGSAVDLYAGAGTDGKEFLIRVNNGADEAFRLQADKDAIFSGSVGIGTASPQGKLHVGSSTGGDPTYRGNIIIDNINITSSQATGGLEFKSDNWTNGYGWKITSIDPDAVAYGTNNMPLVFASRQNNATWSDRFVINGTGNVGIGSIIPAYKLDVVGTSQFSQPVIVGSPTATNHAATKSYVDSAAGGGVGAGTSGQTLRHNGTAWVANSTIYNNGTNVGIGTASPGVKFEVAGGHTNTQFRLYATGFGQPTVSNDAFLSLWASEPGTTYTGVGIGNNIWNSGIDPYDFTRYNSERGGSYIRLLDGAIRASVFNSSGVSQEAFYVNGSGYFGIGTTNPQYALDVRGGGTGYFANPVFVATPTNAGHAATKSYVDSILSGTLSGNFTTLSVTGTSTLSGNWQLGGASLGNINLNGYDIVGVNKITAAVIDPLYEIDGEKYATYGLDTVGLKTEITGRAKLSAQISKSQLSIFNQCNNDSIENSMKIANCKLQNFEYAINFSNIERGSDLWVWYQTVVFSPEDLAVLATPYGSLAKIGYRIEGKTIVFFSDEPTEFSYRLSGKRHDSDVWGTKRDTTEKASFILKAK